MSSPQQSAQSRRDPVSKGHQPGTRSRGAREHYVLETPAFKRRRVDLRDTDSPSQRVSTNGSLNDDELQSYATSEMPALTPQQTSRPSSEAQRSRTSDHAQKEPLKNTQRTPIHANNHEGPFESTSGQREIISIPSDSEGTPPALQRIEKLASASSTKAQHLNTSRSSRASVTPESKETQAIVELTRQRNTARVLAEKGRQQQKALESDLDVSRQALERSKSEMETLHEECRVLRARLSSKQALNDNIANSKALSREKHDLQSLLVTTKTDLEKAQASSKKWEVESRALRAEVLGLCRAHAVEPPIRKHSSSTEPITEVQLEQFFETQRQMLVSYGIPPSKDFELVDLAGKKAYKNVNLRQYWLAPTFRPITQPVEASEPETFEEWLRRFDLSDLIFAKLENRMVSFDDLAMSQDRGVGHGDVEGKDDNDRKSKEDSYADGSSEAKGADEAG